MLEHPGCCMLRAAASQLLYLRRNSMKARGMAAAVTYVTLTRAHTCQTKVASASLLALHTCVRADSGESLASGQDLTRHKGFWWLALK